jgi:Methyltransferase domain
MPFDDKHKAVLNRYLGTEIHTVGGWCIPQIWQALWPLAKLIGPGPIAEIGVFEGKFLTGMIKTFDPDQSFRHAAIDVFDMQQFNLDGAGVGKLAKLDSNLAAHGIDPESVDKVRVDSLTLRAADAERLIARHGPFKLFSVDGCHEVTHTMNDIEFAMSVTDPAGIITVDDYLNPDWPGVLEAVSKMYLLRNFSFVPLIYVGNKLLLCSYSYHDKYLEAVRAYVKSTHPKTAVKQVVRFGFKTLTLKPNMAQWEDLG